MISKYNTWCYHISSFVGPLKYMPLELKTGRASFSSEHKGQLIIYQMMMSELGAPIDSGLLLYLREGVMKEIVGTHNERRDLIFLRNEMVHYLDQLNDPTMEISDKLAAMQLPDPINHRNACASCAYQVLCAMYLKQDSDMWNSLSSNHPLREMAPLVTGHLSEAHIAYFSHWVGLLSLEEREAQKSISFLIQIFRNRFFIIVSSSGSQIKKIWLESLEQRQKAGRAIINLHLDPNVIVESDSFYLNKFELAASSEKYDLTCVGINIGDYLIVSTSNRHNVAAGRVHDLQSDAIVMGLERLETQIQEMDNDYEVHSI